MSNTHLSVTQSMNLLSRSMLKFSYVSIHHKLLIVALLLIIPSVQPPFCSIYRVVTPVPTMFDSPPPPWGEWWNFSLSSRFPNNYYSFWPIFLTLFQSGSSSLSLVLSSLLSFLYWSLSPLPLSFLLPLFLLKRWSIGFSIMLLPIESTHFGRKIFISSY